MGRYVCLIMFLIISLSILTAEIKNKHSNISLHSVQKLIIDTDAGGDDGIAILLMLSAQALSQSPYEIIAITCTYGNTNVKTVVENVRKILTVANKSDIKIYIGSEKPLTSNFTSDNFFGEDGFGDFEFDFPWIVDVDYTKHASVALADLAKTYKGNLSIMTLGPLTNLALASELDSSFINNVNHFFIMGGSVRGVGNVRPGVEYNFHLDPVSDYIVFSSIKKRGGIILLPWETVNDLNIDIKWREQVLGSYNSSYIDFLNNVEAISFTKSTQWTPADAIIAAAALQPNLITDIILVNIEAVMTGEARGAVLVDYANKTNAIPNTNIINGIAKDKLLQFLIQYLG